MSGHPGPFPRLEDWVIVWHSELAGLIADPETAENALRLLDAWAEGARQLARTVDDAALPPPRPPPPPAAPDERDQLIARLLERVDELERRLDRLASPGA